MLSLSDDELAQVMSACQPLAPDRRTDFLRTLAIRGAAVPHVAALMRATTTLHAEIKLPDEVVVVELVGGLAFEGDLAVHDDVA
jgi:hypothetical protein